MFYTYLSNFNLLNVWEGSYVSLGIKGFFKDNLAHQYRHLIWIRRLLILFNNKEKSF